MPSKNRRYPEALRFFLTWVKAPRRVGAVVPSGGSLARLMTEAISPDDGPVLELGPGTGVFTSALLARGISERDLTLVEAGPGFAQLLKARFPGVRILRMDAVELDRHHLFEEASVAAVVSGLPLLAMSQENIAAILSGAFGYLRPEGAFYQFTYGMKCPVPRAILKRLGLESKQGPAFRAQLFPPADCGQTGRGNSRSG
jgi:phospholipid N-methyltransferase